MRARSGAVGVVAGCLAWVGAAHADDPSAPPAGASATPAVAPPPIVLVLDEAGLHAPGQAPLAPSAAPRQQRGLTAARLGLPPQPYLEARPPTLEWKAGEVVPLGYVPHTSVDLGLRNAGISVFSGSAGLSAIFGVGLLLSGDSDLDGSWPLLVPVVGPALAIGTLDASGYASYLLVLDSLTQAAGVTLFVLGWATPRERLERVEPRARHVGLELGPARATFEVSF